MGFFSKIFGTGNNKVKDEVSPTLKVVCPNCQNELPKFPQSKTKCKKCNRDVYVRTHYLTKAKILLTAKQKDQFDDEKRDYFFQKDWLRKLSDLGITDTDVKSARDDLTKKWGHSPAFNDLVWRLFNSKVVKMASGTSLHDLKMHYFTWALFACEIDTDPTGLLQQSHKYELLEYKKGGYTEKVELLSNGGCEACAKNNKKIFNLDELLKENNILPNKSCTHKLKPDGKYAWCRCIFLPIIT